jgi:hypothetical protein
MEAVLFMAALAVAVAMVWIVVVIGVRMAVKAVLIFISQVAAAMVEQPVLVLLAL